MTNKMKNLKNKINSIEVQILASQKDSEDVFDTIDLIMDMDDVKEELRTTLMNRYGELPVEMEKLVQPMHVITYQRFMEDCF